MAEETKPEMGEPVETPIEPKAEAKVDTPAKADDSQAVAELEKTREALKKANKEAAERRKRLEELEAAEKKRAEDAMSETEKLNARLKELETAVSEKDTLLKQKDRQELQRKVAKEVGLPEGLASRIAGETEDEMTADALSVLELLPKQEAKKPAPPKIDPTNPGDGKQGETRAQLKERVRGAKVNPFATGTVTMVEKE
jgi:DNA repair exonuclease SbcCD ATPase subunit